MMNDWSRRDFLKVAGTGATLAAVPGFLSSCAKKGVPLSPASTMPTNPDYFASHFGMDDELIGKVLARAMQSGGDFAELFFEHSVRNYVGLEDGAVNEANVSVNLGVGVRVVKGVNFGYAFTEELNLESMLKAADTAAAIASEQRTVAPVGLKPIALPDYYPIRELWDEVGLDRKMPWLSSVNEQIRQKDQRVVKSMIHYIDESKRILVATSDGVKVEDYQPQTLIYASCVAEENGKRERGGFNIAGRQGPDFFTPQNLTLVADQAVEQTVRLFDAVQPPAGEWPVVLGAGPSGILLHEAIGHGIEADFNRKNTSIFADKIGKKIAIDEVTVLDDGTNDHVRGSINVDDEGTPGQKTVMVEKGVLKTYLHDRISAKHYGLAPTGNGRRQSFRHAPMPRMRNTYMANGPHEPEEIIRSVKKGIYAKVFSNGQVRIGEGSFSFYIQSGNLIEDGKLTAPIKDVNIIGNGPEVLGRVTMVGNDTKLDIGGWTCGKNGQSVPVSQGLPTTLVSNITVGGVRA